MSRSLYLGRDWGAPGPRFWGAQRPWLPAAPKPLSRKGQGDPGRTRPAVILAQGWCLRMPSQVYRGQLACASIRIMSDRMVSYRILSTNRVFSSRFRLASYRLLSVSSPFRLASPVP